MIKVGIVGIQKSPPVKCSFKQVLQRTNHMTCVLVGEGRKGRARRDRREKGPDKAARGEAYGSTAS